MFRFLQEPFQLVKCALKGYIYIIYGMRSCLCFQALVFVILSLCVDFAAQAADIFVFSSDVSVSGRVSFAISSPDSAGVIKENVKRQTSYVSF